MGARETVNVDEVLKGLRMFGGYQFKQYILVSFTYLPAALTLLSIVFRGFPPSFACRPLENASSSPSGDLNDTFYSYGKCEIKVFNNGSGSENKTLPCVNGYQYSMRKDQSIVSEWDLVCGKGGLAELSQTIFIMGQGAGALIFTSLSDRLGRKPVHIFCLLFLMVAGIAEAYSPHYLMFVSFRVLAGMFQQGQIISSFTLLCELFPTDQRTLMVGLGGIIWATCVMVIAPFAYLLRDFSWRIMSLAFALTAATSLFSYWLVDESLRWIFANGKLKEAEKILKKAAKMNKVNFSEIWKRHVEKKEEGSTLSAVESKEKLPKDGKELLGSDGNRTERDGKPKVEQLGIFAIFRNSYTRYVALIFILAWTINSLTYFGLYMTTSSLAGDRFLNFFLTAVCELPSAIISIKMLMRFGRKKTVIIFQSVAGVALLVAVSLEVSAGDNDTMALASRVFSFLGMFGISGSFGSIWVYSPEIFPTNLRSVAVGLFSFSARISSMLAPFARMLADYIPWLPRTIFGVSCILVNFPIFFLPETNNRQLPQTLKDVDNWKKKHQEPYELIIQAQRT